MILRINLGELRLQKTLRKIYAWYKSELKMEQYIIFETQ